MSTFLAHLIERMQSSTSSSSSRRKGFKRVLFYGISRCKTTNEGIETIIKICHFAFLLAVFLLQEADAQVNVEGRWLPALNLGRENGYLGTSLREEQQI